MRGVTRVVAGRQKFPGNFGVLGKVFELVLMQMNQDFNLLGRRAGKKGELDAIGIKNSGCPDGLSNTIAMAESTTDLADRDSRTIERRHAVRGDA